jgi:hypothetical protein
MTNLFVLCFSLQDFLPYKLLFVGDGPQYGLNEILSWLYTKKGKNPPFSLDP